MTFLAATTTTSTTITTIALFAGVIGVVVGVLLKAVLDWIAWRAGTKQRKEDAARDRVLAFIHCGEIIATSGTANARINVDVVNGATLGDIAKGQLAQFSDQFNAAQLQLTRIRVEMAVRGPKWALEPAHRVEKAANDLSRAVTATHGGTQALFDDFLDRAKDFMAARSDFTELARRKYADT